MKRWTVLISVFIVVMLCCAATEAEEYKIAFVDLDQAVNESVAGKKALEKLEQQVKQAEAEMLKKKNEIEKFNASLEKQSSMLKDDVRAEKEKEFIRLQKDYERKGKDLEDELKMKKADLMKEIFVELNTVIEKYAKENKYNFIFEKRLLVYAADAQDITDKIISRYDSQYQAKKK